MAVSVYVAPQKVLNGITGFNLHRGCLALAARPAEAGLTDYQALLDQARRVLVLEGVNNPDNIGGLFRSAAAFGVEVVVLGAGCGDPLYRKAIRTSMAATLKVPFVQAGEWPGALATLRAHGLRLVALTPRADTRLVDGLRAHHARVALLVGSEGDGLSDEALSRADERVRIPMADGIDSLNVVVAASIALHHLSS
ncbi:MAG: TrmH family RNA methyltransferase [Acidobacteriota bacterium]